MLHTILQQACEAANWDYGEAWFVQKDTALLQLSPAWFVHPGLAAERQRAWEQFRLCSEEFVLHLGEGLPGRVGQTQQPEWVDDVSAQSESYFLRNQIAIAFGAKAGFGIPLNVKPRVILVFFLSQAQAQDPQRIAATEAAITEAMKNLPLSGITPDR
ncbi:GAF domain-containing protein [Phormidium tenue FACHB-886]|nr:GAF domain-containing protein [Phormidium tenue FACHB-886]